MLAGQVKIHPTGAVQIGSSSKPMYNTNTTLQVDAKTIVFKTPSGFPIPSNGGFMFYPSIEYIPVGNGLNRFISVAALSGIPGQNSIVGTSDNNMYKIYSTSYYTNGSYLGVLSSSDRELKTNIRDMGTISGKLSKLRPVMYDFVKKSSGEDVSKDPAYQNRVGFIAQEVKEIFPDIVDLGSDTIYRIDYAGLIPYLTKAIQEQELLIQKQNKINEEQDVHIQEQNKINQQQAEEIKKLQQQLQAIQTVSDESFMINAAPKATTGESAAYEQTHLLYQNTPNPFNTSTTIKYKLNEDVTKAKICIYNLTGKQLQCYTLPAVKGEQAIEVQSSSLQAGMYLYSLIVNDTLIATKRMILTE